MLRQALGLATLALAGSVSACSFILDFDELQAGTGGAGGMGGGGGTSGGANAGGSGGAAGNAGAGGTESAGGTAGVGGSAGMGGSGDEGVTLEQAPAYLANAFCNKMVDCAGSAALDLLFFDEECETSLESAFENTVVANVATSLEADTLEYDGTQLPACVEDFAATSCEEVAVNFFEGCKVVLSGLAPDGGDCAHSLECEEGLYCDISACPGTCRAPLPVDAACTEVDTCVAGSVCFEGICSPLGAQDEACGGGMLPECLTGLLCVGQNVDEMQPGSCVPANNLFVVSEDAPCSFDPPSLCREGLSCPVSLAPTCLAAAPSGGACQLSVPDMCPEGEYCNAGTCTALPGVNQPCAAGLIVKPGCQAYLRCVAGTCQRLGDNGNTCGAGEECHSGYCHDGYCAPPQCL